MKHDLMRLVLCVCVLSLVIVREIHAELTPELTIDGFEDHGTAGQYQPFADETVTTLAGYGMYTKRAHVTVSQVARAETGKALHMQYALPPYFAWGNWVSIRKEFPTPFDLMGYQGIKIDIKILTPSNARFRLTLSDVATPADAQIHGKDDARSYSRPSSNGSRCKPRFTRFIVPTARADATTMAIWMSQKSWPMNSM